MKLIQFGTHRFHRLWRRAKRILVGSQLNDCFRVKTPLTGDIFNRLSRFVGDKIAQLWIGKFPDGHGYNRLKRAT